MPQLTAFMLARYAEVSAGRVNMIGGALHSVYVSSLPAESPSLSVVAELIEQGERDSDSSHLLELRLLDPQGGVLASEVQEDFTLFAGSGYGRSVVIVVQATQILLEEEGLHRFVLMFDGEPMGECPFAVRVAEAEASTA